MCIYLKNLVYAVGVVYHGEKMNGRVNNQTRFSRYKDNNVLDAKGSKGGKGHGSKGKGLPHHQPSRGLRSRSNYTSSNYRRRRLLLILSHSFLEVNAQRIMERFSNIYNGLANDTTASDLKKKKCLMISWITARGI